MLPEFNIVEKEEVGFPGKCFPRAIGCLFVNK